MLNAQTKQWSLKECIEHAIEHNISIKQIEIQKQNAEINLNTTQMSRLPDLNAGSGQGWSFGRNEKPDGTYEIQTMATSNFYLSSSTPLFTGFRIPNEIARNKLELKAAIESLEKAKEDLSLNIANLFLQVLFNKELLKISQEQLNLSQTQIERTQFLIDAGKVPMSQLFDIEAQTAKDEVSVIQAENNLNLAFLDLIQALELEQQSADFDIYAPEFDNVIDEFMSSIQPPHIIFDNAVNVKPVIKEQEFRLGSAEKTLKIAQSGYLPTLSLGLEYSNRYFYNYTMEGRWIENEQNPSESYTWHNDSFSNQIRNNWGQNVRLNLQIPIFNRFSVRNQVRSAKSNINYQQLALDNTKKTLFKEIQTAYLNATATQEKYRASEKAVKASTESFRFAQERYEVGKSSVFEFNEARMRLIQSQSEQIQAKYDYIFRTKILDFYNGIPIEL
jgi:outer membrane protein